MEKIKKLRKLFETFNIDGYIVPKNDEFFSEYTDLEKDNLKYISNFSGSFGLGLILKKENYLFVDGRYTLQAKNQSGKFFKIITIPKFFSKIIFKKNKLKIGFDPKLHTEKMLSLFFGNCSLKLVPINQNLINKISIKKTQRKKEGYFILPKNAYDISYKQKIKKLIKIIKKEKIDLQFITASENIAWLLNIRGKDSKYSPTTNAYLTLDCNENINFFCDLKKLNNLFKKRFKFIKFFDINSTDAFLLRIRDKKILIDSSSCSIYFKNIINKNNQICKLEDPIYYLKSIKTKTELKNTIKSHILDGAALTKFLFWIKKNYHKKNISEITAQEKLFEFRKKNKYFQYSSFPTISGSGPNGAIIHYRATKKSNRKLKKGDIYLVDSGGQYNFGTTDVTRTISLDNKDKRIKEIFTRVLKGHIAVASYNIKKNTKGSDIDYVGRKFLKEINLDYAHGTGHGVGYFLNVHEGPVAFSKKNNLNLKNGMIISNEPGYYEKGKFGIRIENLIRVKKMNKKLIFSNLTMAPIDKSLIIKNYLNKKEISWLNNYHKNVFDNLKRYMAKSDIVDLKQACSNI